MRPYPTRLVDSVARAVLLVPSLLICLACATPFPLDSLEEGMTAETVREKFGEPEAIMSALAVRAAFGELEVIETEPGGVSLSWKYLDERLHWQMFIFPQVLLSIPICAAIPDKPWDCGYTYSVPVLLHFEGEKLAHWEVIEPVYSEYYGPTFPMTFPGIDAAHHAAGHTHHHHPGC